ncbi:4-(cytidine 5'-diphospho)-2-C-methyl-D-erythritol kinase [Phaeovibrio sulfidiphilus]|uniref:4-diphosphocytidyl-2-C-methyl-D-erythritol kinase n=1 Tax=Phaeovibrio sulfidiphilus TaxID=1220600 RepID=A0A8J6YMJ0_9PROT|nr:4-(cytidine 5'-diphospho)-2-C-methyl-D-erythritol kinase [Phaeovibrio sulfidiphilus]MBE1236624.1 4-(cytidine 5'-diphospho)-2-C-methyl-D-erythritol kinase [Phaeovibrio sulfidiphilus]
MTPVPAVTEAACAKINLSLHVTGKRPDGYHLLESLVVFCGVHDTVLAEPDSAGLSLHVVGPGAEGLSAENDNIMLRAARALATHVGRAPDVRLTLIKRLPVASGIGGGSADAAATLRALIRLWDLTLNPDALMALALELGADVPVCLAGKAVMMRGIGEDLDPLPALPPLWMVLVNPRRPVSTAAVFRGLAGRYRTPLASPDPTAGPERFLSDLEAWHNDLEAPAREAEPSVSEVLDALALTPGVRLARMSGSGATCFGLYETREEAEAAARAIQAARPDWWVAPGPVLSDTAHQAPSSDRG